ncbi:P-loop ATPase, Sll1717 family [Kineosporia sp. R_H_3]|uniref:P-loop ATPase, Sll1717 family n=1 Tax=Kineosporia sp. R_H_3 TaxID=1961848 RepID=UPI000B4BB306|nr:hypothetical protein [Kineosporia sp. R_H_3]
MTPGTAVPIDLSTVYLGAPSAERDIHSGLEHYFVESEAFRRVASGQKTVILGNRGSGKSAIFQMLGRQAQSRNDVVIELAPEDYSYELLQSALAKESDGAWAKLGAYSVAWKFLIYVLVMKELVSRSGGRPGRGPLAKITAYVRDNHPNTEMSKLSALIGYMKRLEGVKVGGVEAALKTRELEKLYKLEEIHAVLPALREVLEKQRVYVFVDELDRGWDASEDAQAFVAGLFQACMSINNLSRGLTVYMSLRQELYENIPALYDDAQKFRDVIETVSWSEPGLRQLIARRLRYNVRELKDADDEGCWNSVFAETLSYRQNKSFNYMVDRTLFRPRELIQFCATAIEGAQDSRIDPALDYGVILNAETTYSEARTKDIAAEYRFQYPSLLSVFEAFRGRVYSFDRDDLESICMDLILGGLVIDAEAQDWVTKLGDPSDLITILWQVGFLRARAQGGIKAQRRSGSSYLGPHQVSNLRLDNISRFQIHQMFRSYLGLREPKKSASADDE